MQALPSRDEMIDRSGRLRTAWVPVMEAVRELGLEELTRRAAALNRQMRLAAPLAAPLGTPLMTTAASAIPPFYDPLPAPLTASEFLVLEAGVQQRAKLLNLVLEDLYGAQSLLADGGIPPAAIYAQPHFLRSLHTRSPLTTPRLSFYAVDIVRTGERSFSVQQDHTGVISGLGHALNLRRMAAGCLPELFRGGGLRSLRPSREMMIDHLQRQAQGSLVAVLSAGPNGAAGDMTDDALLARALGLLLIEPGDLANRGGALQVKTLSGLLHVGTLIRGLSGLELDPLEQGGRPGAGIPGAFGAIRAGVLNVLNTPGSALVQAQALRPYLAPLFERCLGLPAILPEVTGDAGGNASRALFLSGTELVLTPLVFRLFAWHDGQDWQVLPGGIALPVEAPKGDPGADTAGKTFGMKDIWVLDADEPHVISGAGFVEPLERPKFLAAAHLPSRVADNLFWLGRSVERLESAARVLMLALPRLESATSLPRDVTERALIARCLAQQGLLPAELSSGAVSGRLLRSTLARRKPVARLLREVARLVNAASERLSPSMLSTVRFALTQAAEALPQEELALPAMLNFAATFAGIAAENMSREGSWLFLEMGRRLERGETLAETLGILLDAPVERMEPGLGLGIELADSVLSYDLRHAGILSPAPVLAMLMADVSNPRSLVYQCQALRVCLERLGADDDAEAARLLMSEATLLASVPADLSGRLRGIAARLRLLSDRVHRRFFTLLPEAHQLDDEEEYEAAQ